MVLEQMMENYLKCSYTSVLSLETMLVIFGLYLILLHAMIFLLAAVLLV